MNEYYKFIIDNIKKNTHLSFHDSFNYAKYVSLALENETEITAGRRVIINILDNWEKIDSATRDIWVDLMEAAGFYPYLTRKEYPLKDIASKIRKEFHKSELLENIYFHEEQLKIKKLLDADNNIILSAPTSFGKSLLIKELVYSRKYKNIVIVQPTLALLDETRKNLLGYDEQYKLIVRTSQLPSNEKNNIFLFTAERVIEYDNFPKIDLFILDEFYKLSEKRQDERSSVLNNAFYRLLTRYKCKFYLLGPNIDGISSGFEEAYDAQFINTKYSLVDCETIDVYSKYIGQFGKRGDKYRFKEKILFQTLAELNEEQTIIYCSSPNKVRHISLRFYEYMYNNDVKKSGNNLPLIEWIKNNITPNWSLINCLKLGIGIHDGALPKHITTSILDYFNAGKLRYLFCTSTIIEGVNTSAKNVIFFDNSKGNKKADFFDYSNIKGRAGRLMEHYVGKLYNFNEPIEIEEMIVDIPFYEQNPIQDEVLIQLEDEHVKNKESEQYQKLNSLPPEELELFKKNGIYVWGQKNILDYIENNLELCYNEINWRFYPNYEQLGFILELCWKNLMKKKEAGNMTLKSLIRNVNAYNGSLKDLIIDNFNYNRDKYPQKNEVDQWNESILYVFSLHRKWIHYKIPKWIGVINEIQKFICNKHNEEPGEYTYYANQLDNDFVRENLALLLEFGIPQSTIKKLESMIDKDLPEEDAFKQIKVLNERNLLPLDAYEKEKIQSSL